MSWEQRGNHKYYYAKRRVNGRVVSVYLGRGPAAESAELEVERRAAERRQFQRQKRECEQQDAWIENYCQQVELAIAAQLIAQGFHQHRGELRRTRAPGPRLTQNVCEQSSINPVAGSHFQVTEALAELRPTLGRLDAVLDGVEIKNPKYIALLDRMKGVTPKPNVPAGQQSKSARTGSGGSNSKLNVWQGHHVPSEKLRPARAQLDAAFAGLDRANKGGARNRYNPFPGSSPGVNPDRLNSPSKRPPP